MTLEHPTQQSPSRYPSPTQPKTHRRTELIVDAFQAAVSERWGTTKTRRNHTVIAIVEALAGLPSFAAGGRAAYPTEKLAQRCHRHVRTVEDAVAKLREFPELVHVVLVRNGEPDWKGARCRLAHLEFQVGPVLRGLMEHPATGRAPAVTSGPPRRDAGNIPGLTPADLILAQPTDLELQLKRESVGAIRDDQLNFEARPSEPLPTPPTDTECSPLPPIQTTTDHPKAASPLPHTAAEQPPVRSDSPPPAAARTESPTPGLPDLAALRTMCAAPLTRSRNAPALVPVSPGSESHRRRAEPLAPAAGAAPAEPRLELRFPCWLLEAIIRQHRAMAEGKGPYVPIDDRERARVDGALRGLPGRLDGDALLELCARVSDGALRDARAKGGTVANLRYTFGGPDEDPEEPHKHFHRRVAELREQDEKSARERLDGELTAALLGGPAPLKASPAPLRATPRSHRGLLPPPLGGRRNRTESSPQPEEIQALIARALARMEEPYARTC
jgi:hypothetical protein